MVNRTENTLSSLTWYFLHLDSCISFWSPRYRKYIDACDMRTFQTVKGWGMWHTGHAEGTLLISMKMMRLRRGPDC